MVERTAAFQQRLVIFIHKDDGAAAGIPVRNFKQSPKSLFDGYVLITVDGQFRIRLTDKNENCRIRRNNMPVIDYEKSGGSHV